MPDYSAAEEEILDLHSQFWNALADRDVDLRLSFCKNNVTIIGTGLHERVVGKAAYGTHSEKGKEQLPGKFRLEMLWTHVTLCQDIA